jgi:hypothetical protein
MTDITTINEDIRNTSADLAECQEGGNWTGDLNRLTLKLALLKAEQAHHDDAVLLAAAGHTYTGEEDGVALLTLPRDEAVLLYEATLRESGWKRGRNNIQVCLSDSGFYSFFFAPLHSGFTTVRIVDFTPDC